MDKIIGKHGGSGRNQGVRPKYGINKVRRSVTVLPEHMEVIKKHYGGISQALEYIALGLLAEQGKKVM